MLPSSALSAHQPAVVLAVVLDLRPRLTVEMSTSAHTGKRTIYRSPQHPHSQQRGPTPARKVSILSPHYEPLHSSLIFPHGMPVSSSHAHAQVKNQKDWYRFRLLTEPRFQVFGLLANEYLVDMFSRVERMRNSPTSVKEGLSSWTDSTGKGSRRSWSTQIQIHHRS
jgi:hypothetical protein